MGWISEEFYGKAKDYALEIVKDIFSYQEKSEYKYVGHSNFGNILYVYSQKEENLKLNKNITIYLIKSFGKNEYGYKSIDIFEGPNKCFLEKLPLKWLKWFEKDNNLLTSNKNSFKEYALGAIDKAKEAYKEKEEYRIFLRDLKNLISDKKLPFFYSSYPKYKSNIFLKDLLSENKEEVEFLGFHNKTGSFAVVKNKNGSKYKIKTKYLRFK